MTTTIGGLLDALDTCNQEALRITAPRDRVDLLTTEVGW